MQSVMNESVAHDWGEGGNNAILLRLCIFRASLRWGKHETRRGGGRGIVVGAGEGRKFAIFFSLEFSVIFLL